MRAGRKLGWCRLMPDLKWPRFVINESYTQPPKALSILAQSRSDIRGLTRHLYGLIPDFASLNPGYASLIRPTSSSSSLRWRIRVLALDTVEKIPAFGVSLHQAAVHLLR